MEARKLQSSFGSKSGAILWNMDDIVGAIGDKDGKIN